MLSINILHGKYILLQYKIYRREIFPNGGKSKQNSQFLLQTKSVNINCHT